MKRLIIFLIRKRLGLKKNRMFRFANQKQPGLYYFTDTQLMKITFDGEEPSGVSLNWLLDKDCKVVKKRCQSN